MPRKPRKTLAERLASTLKSMKARARKDGQTVEFTAADLETRIPGNCEWCGKKITPATLNVDHLVPVSRGGSWQLDNLIGVCAGCNRKKGSLTHAEYEALLRKLNELTDLFADDYLKKNVLARMAAGGAWIHS